MDMDKHLYFLAILPPRSLQSQVRSLQMEMAERFESRASLKSPPHITLIPPLQLNPEQVTALLALLRDFAAQTSVFSIHLKDFAVFAPRVIYIHVEPTPALITCQHTLRTHLEGSDRFQALLQNSRPHPFVPHLTLAFRDLSEPNFQQAWTEFQQRSFSAQFPAHGLTLLRHDGQQWQIQAQLLWGNGLDS